LRSFWGLRSSYSMFSLSPYQNTRRHAWIFNNSFEITVIKVKPIWPPWMEEILKIVRNNFSYRNVSL